MRRTRELWAPWAAGSHDLHTKDVVIYWGTVTGTGLRGRCAHTVHVGCLELWWGGGRGDCRSLPWRHRTSWLPRCEIWCWTVLVVNHNDTRHRASPAVDRFEIGHIYCIHCRLPFLLCTESVSYTCLRAGFEDPTNSCIMARNTRAIVRTAEHRSISSSS